jgi:hypothetical protein
MWAGKAAIVNHFRRRMTKLSGPARERNLPKDRYAPWGPRPPQREVRRLARLLRGNRHPPHIWQINI